MNELIVKYEIVIRLSCFFGVFALMAVWEMASPRRVLAVKKSTRWLNNIGLVVLNSVMLRILFPAAAVGVALLATERGWGVFNLYPASSLIAIVVSIVTLDFIIYLQHVMVHAVPVLWRLHRVHHVDLDIDVTTGSRFHPLEIILSMLIKFTAIVLLGPPVVAVIMFEILLNATAMFNHSNVKLPLGLDRILRWVMVTPDMHRVHHSVEEDETNSNFGFNLPWWDRLMGTYRAQPRMGHEAMSIGIHTYREPKQVQSLPKMLVLPFISELKGYAINRRRWDENDEH